MPVIERSRPPEDSTCERWRSLILGILDDLRPATRPEGSPLRGADLSGAKFTVANLQGADFQDANLRDADLRRANLIDADLFGADLRGATLIKEQLEGANGDNTTMVPKYPPTHWRVKTDGQAEEGYSPECVEGEFCEVYIDNPAYIAL
jgi:Pentapeptide repeats (8 copies)